MPPATGQEVLTVLLGLAALGGIALIGLSIADKVRSLRARPPAPPEPDRHVRRRELGAMRRHLTDRFAELEKKVGALEAYTHQSVHELRDGLHRLGLRQEEMHRQLLQEMHAASDQVLHDLADNSRVMAALAARVEVLRPGGAAAEKG